MIQLTQFRFRTLNVSLFGKHGLVMFDPSGWRPSGLRSVLREISDSMTASALGGRLEEKDSSSVEHPEGHSHPFMSRTASCYSCRERNGGLIRSTN
jgi:hypothetical protein